MAISEILSSLEKERDALIRLRDEYVALVAKYDSAIAALKGESFKSPIPVSRNERNRVSDMIEEAANLLSVKTPGVVFDYKVLITVASELYPQEHSRIKRGVYCSFSTLKSNGIFAKVPNGYTLVKMKGV